MVHLMRKICTQIRSEFQLYSKRKRLFLLFAMICGFLITAEYAIIKPTSESILLAHYDLKVYPYLWLLTIPFNFVVVFLYNYFVSRLGCFRVFLGTVALAIGIHSFSAVFISFFPPFALFLCIWRDVYILLMFQQLWSVIHINVEVSKAKYLYGIIFGVSGAGSILGSLAPGFLAIKIGSQSLLYLTIPFYLILSFMYYQMLKQSEKIEETRLQIERKKGGFQLIYSSRSLKFIFAIVILMQLSMTVIEYQFTSFVYQKFFIQDLRTQFYGRLWGMINLIKLFLQFFATFLLLKVLDLKKSQFVVPGILLGNAVVSLIIPSFSVIGCSFSLIKIFDYSLFNILKEILYVPLGPAEKFKAKAIIDVFGYRSAKGLASFFIISLTALAPEKLPYAYSWGPFICFGIWMVTVFFYLREKEEKLLEA